MPRWFNYSLLHPLLCEYRDDGSTDLFVIPIEVKGVGQFEAAAIGGGGAVTMLRVTTLDSDGNLTPQQIEVIETVKAHLLAVLRLTYDIDIQEAHRMGSFISLGTRDVDERPDLNLRFEVPRIDTTIDWNNVKNVYTQSYGIKPLMILISDMQNGSLPLQYRYLSLYKAFEFEFRSGSQWRGLKETLAIIEEEYMALNLGKRKFLGLFHDLRDRCAHIKTGSKDRLGIVGLPDQDLQVVGKILPLLINCLFNHINKKYAPLTFGRK